MVKPFKVIEKFIDQQDRIADFVQNGPADGLPGYVRDQYRKRCDQFANLPGWARSLGNGTTGTMNRICKPYWDDNAVDGPVLAPPFTGGQCNCQTYQIDYVVQGTSDQFGGPFTRSGCFRTRGPLSGPRKANNNSQFEFTSNSNRVGCSNIPGTCGAPRNTVIDFWGFPSADAELTTFNVSPIGTATDLCGDPPPELRPGPNPPADPGPTPGPEPTDDPFGGPIPDLPIPPYEDPIFGPTPIDPGEEPGGGGGPPAGGDGLPGEPDAVGDPVGSTGAGGDGEEFPFGTPPAGKVWVGAIIENTVDPRYGNIPGTGPENTVYPYVIGNAHLTYSTGRSSSSRMRSRWHDIYRPVTALDVTGCFVQCRPGVSASVRPVSATICPENPCEE